MKMNKDWIREVSVKDLPETAQEIAGMIGLGATVKLHQELGGTYIYFPKLDKFLIPIRDSNIQKDFNGVNINELAKKYDLSTTAIRRILKSRQQVGRTP